MLKAFEMYLLTKTKSLLVLNLTMHLLFSRDIYDGIINKLII